MEAFKSDNQLSYFQTRIRELEARCDTLQARCDTWQAKYDEMRDAYHNTLLQYKLLERLAEP
jgi:hypothetical protein